MCTKPAAERPPAAAASEVVVRTKEVRPGSALNTEPPLKPNHPNQRISTPAAAKGRLCPGIASGLPSLSYFPILGPSLAMYNKAAQPPTLCTSVDPAKS